MQEIEGEANISLNNSLCQQANKELTKYNLKLKLVPMFEKLTNANKYVSSVFIR